MSDPDTLLLCSGEKGSNRNRTNWLVALSRNGSDWHEAQRVQIDADGAVSSALCGSRVLIGKCRSAYMELFHVESGPRIAPLHHIEVPEAYYTFSASCGSNSLVAISYEDQSVRVYQLCGDRLEELARIKLKLPSRLLWFSNRLLVADMTMRRIQTPSLSSKWWATLDSNAAANSSPPART